MTVTYDLFSPAHFATPYETFALMRQNDPLYCHEQTGLWFVSRYQDVHAVLRDRRFSAARVDGFMPTDSDEKTQVVRRFFTDWMVFQDPPEHTRLRKLISRAFAPRSIAALESYIQLVVDESLDRVKDQEQIDIIRDLALPVPAQVIAHMLGVAPTASMTSSNGRANCSCSSQWSATRTRISPPCMRPCATWRRTSTSSSPSAGSRRLTIC
jgi:cytochrome P450